jgi:hypothetical protein
MYTLNHSYELWTLNYKYPLVSLYLSCKYYFHAYIILYVMFITYNFLLSFFS